MMNPLLTLRYAAETPLICRMLREPVRGAEYTFPDSDSLSIIPREVCLFHGCRDGSLIARLRDTSKPVEEVFPTGETCVVCLGRYGDIVNALPIARDLFNQTQTKPGFMTCKEWSPLLEGTGYVVPEVYPGNMDGIRDAIAKAATKYKTVIRAQVYNTPDHKLRKGKCYNHQAWVAAGFSNRWRDPMVKLAFDNRNLVRERELISANVKREAKPIILYSFTSGFSSPFSDGSKCQERFVKELGDTHQLINLSTITAERIYDMLALFEVADALVSTDTVWVHLAAAMPRLPVYMLHQLDSWYKSELRCNLVWNCAYPAWESEFPKMVDSIRKLPRPRVWHAFEKHKTLSDRAKRAQLTWVVLYEAFGWKAAPLIPYPRDARKIGDARDLPFIRDILQVSLNQAEDQDVIVMTNDDIILMPAVHEEIMAAMAQVPILVSSRRDIWKFGELGTKPPVPKHSHVGRDLLAVKAWWLRDHWSEFPDFIIGARDWDTCFTIMARKACGIKVGNTWSMDAGTPQIITACELASGNVLHEFHSSMATNDCMANRWNLVQMAQWQHSYAPEMCFPWCDRMFRLWKSGQFQFGEYKK
jgi:hypothetical protein